MPILIGKYLLVGALGRRAHLGAADTRTCVPSNERWKASGHLARAVQCDCAPTQPALEQLEIIHERLR